MMQQRSPAWYAARCGVLTASRFADVLAKPETAAYRNYALQLATERVTGQPQDSEFTNAAMQWGIDTEPQARSAYEAQSGNIVTDCGLLLHPDHSHIGASPDGLIDADGLIECKCPKSTTHYSNLLERKLPAEYRPQVQGQLYVTGRRWADFISFDPRFPPHLQLLVVRVERDEIYIAMLAERLQAFNAGVLALMERITQ